MDRQPIETAPRDGTAVRLMWIVEGRVEHEEKAAFQFDEWRGLGWLPYDGHFVGATHWLPNRPEQAG